MHRRHARALLPLLPLALAAASAVAAEPSPEDSDEGPFVVSKGTVKVTLSGRVHRMVLGVDDGASEDAFFTDSDQGPTMLKVAAERRGDEGFSVGAGIELGIQSNRPFKVAQDSRDPGTDVTVRQAEVILDSTRWGKLSFGRGFAAGWLSAEMDLSGTQFAALLPVGMLAPGMKFVDRSTGELSGVQVLQHFIDVERLLIHDRVRYDSPSFAGSTLSSSAASDGRWDLALRTRHAPGSFTLAAGATYQSEPFAGIEERTDGVVTVRHEPTGLNATFGATRDEFTMGPEGTSFLVKLGWLADLSRHGKTAFAIDYYQASDIRFEGDEATSIGFVVLQSWNAWGLTAYTGIRRFQVDRPDVELEDLLVVPVGMVLSF